MLSSLSLSAHTTRKKTLHRFRFSMKRTQRNEPMRKKETEIHSPHELFVLEKRLRKHFTRETLVQQETQTRMLSSLSLSQLAQQRKKTLHRFRFSTKRTQRNEPTRKKETEIHSPHELFVLEKRLRKHFTRETLVQQETQTRMLSFSAQETQKHGCSASQVQENT